MRVLTRAEEEVMQVLWNLKRGFAKDVLAEFEEPKPAYNTISTILRILVSKEFVAYKAYGKTYEYFTLVSRDEYKSFYLKRFIKGYFDGSFQNLVSFFAKDEKLDTRDLDDLLSYVKEDKKQGRAMK
jgi:predicted transcriptional regulator